MSNVENAAEPTSLSGPSTAEPLALPDFHSARRRRNVVLVVLALAGVCAFFVFRPSEVEEDLLRTERVERRDVARVVSLTGHIDARTRVDVPAPMSSRIATIDVSTGDRVQVGQQLATLDARQVDLSLGMARAQLGTASSQLENARLASEAAVEELRRLESLVERGLASEADLASARTREAQARATYRAARSQRSGASSSLAQAQLNRELFVLRAPIEGVVLSAPRVTGSVVVPERGPLFVIGSDLSTMHIDASVGEADIGAVGVGQEAVFDVPAYVGRSFPARVTHVVPQGNVQGGTTSYTVHLEAANEDGALLPGMTTMLRIEVARASGVLTVHEGALRFTPEGAPPAPPRTRVWVRTGPNRLEPVLVRAGVSDGAFTEVTPEEPGTLVEGADIAIGASATLDSST